MAIGGATAGNNPGDNATGGMNGGMGTAGGHHGDNGGNPIGIHAPNHPSVSSVGFDTKKALAGLAALGLPGAAIMGMIGGSTFGSSPNDAINGATNSNIGNNSNGGGSVDGRPTLQQTIQSILSGNPITDAASIQSDAYTQGQELLAPYLNAGTSALPALSRALGMPSSA